MLCVDACSGKVEILKAIMSGLYMAWLDSSMGLLWCLLGFVLLDGIYLALCLVVCVKMFSRKKKRVEAGESSSPSRDVVKFMNKSAKADYET